jgi:hypothetical protein
MIFQELFNNNFEIIIPDFLTTILLILLLFGVFYKTKSKYSKKLLCRIERITTLL